MNMRTICNLTPQKHLGFWNCVLGSAKLWLCVHGTRSEIPDGIPSQCQYQMNNDTCWIVNGDTVILMHAHMTHTLWITSGKDNFPQKMNQDYHAMHLYSLNCYVKCFPACCRQNHPPVKNDNTSASSVRVRVIRNQNSLRNGYFLCLHAVS